MPNAMMPLGPNASLDEVIRVMNANFSLVDQDVVTKTFAQPGGNAILEGKLPYGGYGTLYYDSNNIPSIIVGMLPDGTVGILCAKPGVDVTTLVS